MARLVSAAAALVAALVLAACTTAVEPETVKPAPTGPTPGPTASVTPAVTATPPPEASSPPPAPDGVLAFAAGGSIYTVRADGTDLTRVVAGTRDPAPDAAFPVVAPDWASTPAFSPDGSLLLFTRDFDLWIANADGSDALLLADVGEWKQAPGASNFSLGAQSAAWSPDGRRIAYALSRIGGSGVNEIWTLEQPFAGQALLIHRTSVFLTPVWLDAEHAGFFEGGAIRVFDAETGGEAEPVDLGTTERHPLSVQAGSDGVWLAGPFISAGPVRYGPPGAMEVVATGLSPTFSPDGRWFAYFSADRLRIAAVDGSESRELVNLAPLGGRDRHHASACSPGGGSGCGYRPPLISWSR